MKKFYAHLVEMESIFIELDRMELSKQEKLHLAHLIDSSLHHTILDAIFSELSDQDKKIFMQHLTKDDHQKIWQFLNEKVDDIEIKIKKAAEDLTAELKKDLTEAERLR